MSLLNHIAILGRQPDLGLLELEAVLGAAAVQPFGRRAALTSEVQLARLGGTVKLARVLYAGNATGLRELPVAVDELPLQSSKTPFGLSVYGQKTSPREVGAAGLELKKQLRKRGSVRLVMPAKGTALTAAELHHNRVLEHGFELVVLMEGRQMVVAQTVAVQDIGWYSRRDYERPARSAQVGMLPPKLAQILVNTTSAAVVADPFCGTGVVLQEARLLGRRAVGLDLAPEMIEATRRNMTWLDEEMAGRGGLTIPDWSVEGPVDARTVKLPQAAAVVSEGYLGPNMSKSPDAAELRRIQEELRQLYRVVLANFARQLPAGGEVSITAPAWRMGREWSYLGIVDELSDLGYTLKGFKHVPATQFRSPLLYARDDQVVGRQLLLLRKN
jgi:tRNA (guanine10-N2)-dimethyltransferase